MRHTWLRTLLGAALAIGAVALFLFWPTSLGGATSYVTTHGISMRPWIRQGDLVLVRQTSTYHVGDVAAYHAAAIDGDVVLHRIIGRDGDRFVFKGDNNSFVDPDHPTRSQMIGTLWVHIPHGGTVMSALRAAMPYAVGAIGLLAAAGSAQRNRRRRGKPRHLAPRARRSSSTRTLRTVTYGAAGVTLVSAAAGAIAFGVPARIAHHESVRYQHSAAFSYDAPTTVGAVYPTGHVRSGDPVFLRLVQGLDVAVDYDLATSATHTVHGDVTMAAEVSDSSGWKRTLPLATATPFRGDHARATAHLDLAELQHLVDDVQAQTGVRGTTHRVALVPAVHVSGLVAGKGVESTYHPRLDFDLDSLQLRLAAPAEKDPLHVQDASAIDRVTTSPHDLHAFGQRVPVGATRDLAVAAGLPAALVAGVGGVRLRRRLRGEVARIELRHGHRLVPVMDTPATAPMVELTSMEDLARLAEQLGYLILHRETRTGHDYLVQADGMTYRYHTAAVLGPETHRS